MSGTKPIVVALHQALDPWLPEVKYALGTMLEIAGYPVAWRWFEPGVRFDLYYGPFSSGVDVSVAIPWCGRPFSFLTLAQPRDLVDVSGTSVLSFEETGSELARKSWTVNGDLVFGAFWLLNAPYEPQVPRSRTDDLDLTGTFVWRNGLLSRPLVSEWGMLLRRLLSTPERPAVRPRWAGEGAVGFVFTHDVDYPEIIPWIEAPRLLFSGRDGAWRLARDVVRGSSHYWTFREWMDLERELGARGTFFFMARQGSLLRYASGTPDDFYDITSPRFRALFDVLRDEGFEVGLHASYHANRSARVLRQEMSRLEAASGAEVSGNRHHYWHLDPSAPHETLRKHETAGFSYDCSLGLEYYPGFRRGITHPFRPWHPGERRAIDVIQLPTAWMDDHFDRRLPHNGIRDPQDAASRLVECARATDGLIVVDYHSRGMNEAVYPRYGPWLRNFVQQRLGSARFMTAAEADVAWRAREAGLSTLGSDLAVPHRPRVSVSEGQPAACSDDVTVAELGSREEPSWEEFVARHPSRTPYHTLPWRAVTVDGMGHQPHYLRATDETGRIGGVLPLFLVKGISGRRLVSVPMRDRAGVLADSPGIAEKLLDAAIAMARDAGAVLEIRQEEPLGSVLRRVDVHVVNQWVTTRVDLTGGRDAVWQGLDKDAVRWAIRRATKEGVVVERDESGAAIDLFYDLFSRTRHRMGIPPFPRAFFRAMQQHLLAPGHAELHFVRCGPDTIGALISMLSHPRAILPAYSAPQNEWRRLYPNEAMFWHVMAGAIDRGYQTFDFGADSPRQEGLLFSKRKWGGMHRVMSGYVWRPDGGGADSLDSSAPRYEIARAVWRRLPGAVSRWLGARVTRRMA